MVRALDFESRGNGWGMDPVAADLISANRRVGELQNRLDAAENELKLFRAGMAAKGIDPEDVRTLGIARAEQPALMFDVGREHDEVVDSHEAIVTPDDVSSIYDHEGKPVRIGDPEDIPGLGVAVGHAAIAHTPIDPVPAQYY